MTDNEIMTLEKALFILRHGSAEGEHKYFEAITIVENEINRQQAEIERLEKGWKADILLTQNTKAEAYKEFAEWLKNEIISDTAYGCDINQHSGYYDYQIKIGDIPEYIDNLLKEMVGDNNA